MIALEGYANMKNDAPVCIIGGYDKLSKTFYDSILRSRNNSIFINVGKYKASTKNIFNLKIFELKKIFVLLKKNQINNVVFLGKIHRPDLSAFKQDGVIDKYIPILYKSFSKGDGSILSTVIEIFRQNFYTVLSPNKISSEFFFDKNEVKHPKTQNDKGDIFKATRILNELSKYDNAQSIVIVNGYIIAIEAAEGTDNLLKRSKKIREDLTQINKKEGVLIKIPKKKQSKLVDLPVIGPKTIRLTFKANLNGIAFNRKYTMVDNKHKTLKLASEYNINLYDVC